MSTQGELPEPAERGTGPELNLDVPAWTAWAHAGFRLFAGGRLPTMREVVREARRVALAVSAERHGGNITHIARALGLQRHCARKELVEAGLCEPRPAPRRAAPARGGKP